MQKYLVILLISISTLTGCGVPEKERRTDQSNSDNNTPLTIVASFYPLAYFTQEIGGSFVEVTTITPAGAEPHDYEPS
ncbi:MAG: zinc ABC transporter substrate-binding protein, partial [Candidatus Gracilibacteria bacterium]|nr:zinc ABC transporter substrate-binding protein [Candidatus Gracilibacteria bacterium]